MKVILERLHRIGGARGALRALIPFLFTDLVETRLKACFGIFSRFFLMLYYQKWLSRKKLIGI